MGSIIRCLFYILLFEWKAKENDFDRTLLLISRDIPS
jgi:hypothetical protein